MTRDIPALLAQLATRIGATRPIVALDLETTGVNPETDRIVELTITRYTPSTGLVSGLETRLNPLMPIPAESSAIHGITDADVAGCLTFKAVSARVFDLLHGVDLVGFNHRRFDTRVLAVQLAACGLPNPMAEARTIDASVIFQKREPRTLEAAVKFFCGREHEGAHGTTADVVATLEVLLAQLDRYDDLPRSIDALDALGRDPSWIDREGKIAWKGGRACINFGKYAGVELAHLVKVDQGFLLWLLGRDFPADTKTIVRAALRGEYPVPPVQPVGAGS